jgi:DNA invertase Pin-like site-specific DNA recombinase
MKGVVPKPLRCAIYTRVSTDHGLEQEFNSLDNQREAAQAYVKSQAQEGWRLIRDRYDDGGFSGGNQQRPALHKLLVDIRARRIDIVVVYKVDRLTRSLTDFAKLVELFDAHSVSFVSVTQSFHTTTSMGRLTLNVLLSFAQFEREVTGERIRDKIAASKKKGIWVGGVVPLGYALHDRKLVIDAAEAATVRLVFERYLALGSLSLLQRELRDRNIVTRARPMASGGTRGGVPLTNGPLNHMLRNRIYLGEINHRESSYPGEHAPIIDRDLFENVQTKLNENRIARGMRRTRSESLLLGRLYDDRGNRMSPSYAIKKGARYRYYISCVVQQGRKEDAGSVPRVAAQDVEGIVINTLAALLPSDQDADQASECEPVERLVERITVSRQAIEILLAKPNVATTNPIVVPWSPQAFRRKREVIQPTDSTGTRPIRAESRIRLLNGIAKARHWLGEILAGSVPDIETISQRENMSARTARMTLSLAFIAPDIVEAVANGTLPRGFGLSRLTDLPLSWAKQRQKLGLPARS